MAVFDDVVSSLLEAAKRMRKGGIEAAAEHISETVGKVAPDAKLLREPLLQQAVPVRRLQKSISPFDVLQQGQDTNVALGRLRGAAEQTVEDIRGRVDLTNPATERAALDARSEFSAYPDLQDQLTPRAIGQLGHGAAPPVIAAPAGYGRVGTPVPAVGEIESLLGLPSGAPLTPTDAMDLLTTLDRGRLAKAALSAAPSLADAEQIAVKQFPDLLDASLPSAFTPGANLAAVGKAHAKAFNSRVLLRSLGDIAEREADALEQQLGPLGDNVPPELAAVYDRVIHWRVRQWGLDARLMTFSRELTGDGRTGAPLAKLMQAGRFALAAAHDNTNAAARGGFVKLISEVVDEAGRSPLHTTELLGVIEESVRMGAVEYGQMPLNVREWYESAGATLKALLLRGGTRPNPNVAELVPWYRALSARVLEDGWVDPETIDELITDGLLREKGVMVDEMNRAAKHIDYVNRFHSMPYANAKGEGSRYVRSLPENIRHNLQTLFSDGNGGFEALWRGTLTPERAGKLHMLMRQVLGEIPYEGTTRISISANEKETLRLIAGKIGHELGDKITPDDFVAVMRAANGKNLRLPSTVWDPMWEKVTKIEARNNPYQQLVNAAKREVEKLDSIGASGKFSRIDPTTGRPVPSDTTVIPPGVIERGVIETIAPDGTKYRYRVHDVLSAVAKRLNYEIEIVRHPLTEARYSSAEDFVKGLAAKLSGHPDYRKAMTQIIKEARATTGLLPRKPGQAFEAGRISLTHTATSAGKTTEPAAVSTVVERSLPKDVSSLWAKAAREAADGLGEVLIVRGPNKSAVPFYDVRAALAYMQTMADNEARVGQLPIAVHLQGLRGKAIAWLDNVVASLQQGAYEPQQMVPLTRLIGEHAGGADMHVNLLMARDYVKFTGLKSLGEVINRAGTPAEVSSLVESLVKAKQTELYQELVLSGRIGEARAVLAGGGSAHANALGIPRTVELLNVAEEMQPHISELIEAQQFVQGADTGTRARLMAGFVEHMQEVADNWKRTGGC